MLSPILARHWTLEETGVLSTPRTFTSPVRIYRYITPYVSYRKHLPFDFFLLVCDISFISDLILSLLHVFATSKVHLS